MKSTFLLCFLGLLVLVMTDPVSFSRGCIYIEGRCAKECSEGTHGYSVGCAPVVPEATCNNPHPVAEKHATCDYSACYCDAPTVRDTESDKCVTLDQCPKKA